MIGYSSFEEVCLIGEKTAKEHQEDEELWIEVLPLNEIRANPSSPSKFIKSHYLGFYRLQKKLTCTTFVKFYFFNIFYPFQKN